MTDDDRLTSIAECVLKVEDVVSRLMTLVEEQQNRIEVLELEALARRPDHGRNE